jgi:uncharacterized membrane protein YeaQ/YmgE (transglycosylase-associated protein family)
MKYREDYLFGMLGGSVLGLISNLDAARILETIILAAIGAVISFFVTRALRWCWKKW